MKKIRLTEAELTNIIKRVIQQESNVTNSKNKPLVEDVTDVSKQYGPYCQIGVSKGIIKHATTGTKGKNVEMGETGLGLYKDNGELICLISTKHKSGTSVVTPSNN